MTTTNNSSKEPKNFWDFFNDNSENHVFTAIFLILAYLAILSKESLLIGFVMFIGVVYMVKSYQHWDDIRKGRSR